MRLIQGYIVGIMRVRIILARVREKDLLLTSAVYLYREILLLSGSR